MNITLTPQRRDARLRLERHNDTLTINGEQFDLSIIPNGAVLPRDAVTSDWFASDIERKDGVLHLTVIVPHGPAAPHKTLFPATLHLIADGPVALPPYGDVT